DYLKTLDDIKTIKEELARSKTQLIEKEKEISRLKEYSKDCDITIINFDKMIQILQQELHGYKDSYANDVGEEIGTNIDAIAYLSKLLPTESTMLADLSKLFDARYNEQLSSAVKILCEKYHIDKRRIDDIDGLRHSAARSANERHGYGELKKVYDVAMDEVSWLSSATCPNGIPESIFNQMIASAKSLESRQKRERDIDAYKKFIEKCDCEREFVQELDTAASAFISGGIAFEHELKLFYIIESERDGRSFVTAPLTDEIIETRLGACLYDHIKRNGIEDELYTGAYKKFLVNPEVLLSSQTNEPFNASGIRIELIGTIRSIPKTEKTIATELCDFMLQNNLDNNTAAEAIGISSQLVHFVKGGYVPSIDYQEQIRTNMEKYRNQQ
ncbi:MAG: hypothetical protein V1870_03225, partial [Candidatus Aenigmatarchaeota archaeon]